MNEIWDNRYNVYDGTFGSDSAISDRVVIDHTVNADVGEIVVSEERQQRRRVGADGFTNARIEVVVDMSQHKTEIRFGPSQSLDFVDPFVAPVIQILEAPVQGLQLRGRDDLPIEDVQAVNPVLGEEPDGDLPVTVAESWPLLLAPQQELLSRSYRLGDPVEPEL